jgi:nitroimidazol reductase NimA-like FMN-containing flavoprotein (pyridoxamine 5'-phosphate oxidase superfamily)
MTASEPVAELDPRFSSPDATPTPWPEARRRLQAAEIFWLSTVRPEGQPHVTPLIAVWLDEALYFCTGPTERKARNLEGNTHCVLTTGCNTIDEGVDVVVEGDAVRTTDEATLQRVADVYASKYGEPFLFTVRDGSFRNDESGEALVFRVAPMKAFGFGKGDTFSQTRWRFEGSPAKD